VIAASPPSAEQGVAVATLIAVFMARC